MKYEIKIFTWVFFFNFVLFLQIITQVLREYLWLRYMIGKGILRHSPLIYKFGRKILIIRTQCHLAEINYKLYDISSPGLRRLKQSTHGSYGHGVPPTDKPDGQCWLLRVVQISKTRDPSETRAQVACLQYRVPGRGWQRGMKFQLSGITGEAGTDKERIDEGNPSPVMSLLSLTPSPPHYPFPLLNGKGSQSWSAKTSRKC